MEAHTTTYESLDYAYKRWSRCRVMKRFRLDHIVPPESLLTSEEFGHPDQTISLQTHVETSLATLRNACHIPAVQYSVAWKHALSNSLATTWTYMEQKVDGVYAPALRFDIEFNTRFLWWAGECAQKPTSHYDLDSVMMHELLHGLGYMSTVDGDKRAWPSTFDMLLTDIHQQSVIAQDRYTGEFGDPVYIDHVRIYNPQHYEPGSSLSHEDPPSQLMSKSLQKSTCHHTLSDDTLFVLGKLGYHCNDVEPAGHRTGGGGGQDTTLPMVIGGGVGALVLIGILVAVMYASKSKDPVAKKPAKTADTTKTLLKF